MLAKSNEDVHTSFVAAGANEARLERHAGELQGFWEEKALLEETQRQLEEQLTDSETRAKMDRTRHQEQAAQLRAICDERTRRTVEKQRDIAVQQVVIERHALRIKALEGERGKLRAELRSKAMVAGAAKVMKLP